MKYVAWLWGNSKGIRLNALVCIVAGVASVVLGLLMVWLSKRFIDATTIENVFNTRYSEASGFFSWGLWLSILVLGVLPAAYCLMQPVVFGRAKRMGICCGSALVIVLVIAATHIGQTLWISQHDTELATPATSSADASSI